jgi:hypothetical protein
LWYWKINIHISLLKEIRDLLRYNVPDNITEEISRNYSNNPSDLPKWSKQKDDAKEKTQKDETIKIEQGQWKCRCGNINESSITNCSKCGRAPNAII